MSDIVNYLPIELEQTHYIWGRKAKLSSGVEEILSVRREQINDNLCVCFWLDYIEAVEFGKFIGIGQYCNMSNGNIIYINEADVEGADGIIYHRPQAVVKCDIAADPNDMADMTVTLSASHDVYISRIRFCTEIVENDGSWDNIEPVQSVNTYRYAAVPLIDA